MSPGADFDLDTGIEQYAQTLLQTVTDADGARGDFLSELWNRTDVKDMVLATVGIYPTSSSGSYSTTGRGITPTDPGSPFPAGGSVINIGTVQGLRNFRIQAVTGGTVTFVGTLYR